MLLPSPARKQLGNNEGLAVPVLEPKLFVTPASQRPNNRPDLYHCPRCCYHCHLFKLPQHLSLSYSSISLLAKPRSLSKLPQHLSLSYFNISLSELSLHLSLSYPNIYL